MPLSARMSYREEGLPTRQSCAVRIKGATGDPLYLQARPDESIAQLSEGAEISDVRIDVLNPPKRKVRGQGGGTVATNYPSYEYDRLRMDEKKNVGPHIHIKMRGRMRNTDQIKTSG